MKKVIASIILFMVTIFSVVNCFAKVELTKEKLQEAYNKLAQKYQGSYTTIKGSAGYMTREESTPVKVEDGQLVYEYEELGKKITKNIKYSLSDKPTFYVEKTITKDSTLSELYDIGKEMELPIIGVVGSAIVQGVDDKTADSFKSEFDAQSKIRKYNTIMLAGDQLSVGNTESDLRVFKKGETDNFEYLDYAINDNVELKDELFNFYTYKFTKTKNNDNEYLLKAEIVVNLDADLSNIIAKQENNTVDNKVNNVTVISAVSTSNNTTNNTVNNTTNNTVNNVVNNTINNVVNNPEKVPYVGADTTVPKLICVFSVIALINFVKLKNLDRKDND